MKRTQLQLTRCVDNLKKRLSGKVINQEQNKEVVAGYKAAVEIVSKGIDNIENYDLSNLCTPQSRAIAFLAVDFVKGDSQSKVLLKIPLKKK